jgi:hypothetical protein
MPRITKDSMTLLCRINFENWSATLFMRDDTRLPESFLLVHGNKSLSDDMLSREDFTSIREATSRQCDLMNDRLLVESTRHA